MKRLLLKSVAGPAGLAVVLSLGLFAGHMAAQPLTAHAATGAVLADLAPTPGGNGRGVTFDGKNLWYTLEFDHHIYEVTTSGTPIASITVAAAQGGPLGWDGSALWTADYSNTSQILRIDPTNGNVLGSCDFVAANPGDPAVTTPTKSIGYYPDGLSWSTTDNAVWLSGEGGLNAGNWVAELNPTTCKDLKSFVGPPAGTDGTSGVAFVADPFNGDRLWQAHPDVSDIFQTDTSGVVTMAPFRAAHLEEGLAFDGVTFAPTCAVWANSAALSNNNLTAYEVPCPERPTAAEPGTGISSVEGQAFGPVTVATFHDPELDSPAKDYMARIDWGDKTSSAGSITDNGKGNFTVMGSHAYAEEGHYVITVTITDIDTPKNTTSVKSTAAVADAALSGTCLVPAIIAPAFAGPTAQFTDANPAGTLTDFSATIDWGDNTSSAGVVTGPAVGPGPYQVQGAHTYTRAGPFVITTTITDVGGSTLVVKCGTSVPACDQNGGNDGNGDGNGDGKDNNSDKHTSDNHDFTFKSDTDDENQACIEQDEEQGDNNDNDQKQVDMHDNRSGDDFHATRVDSVTVGDVAGGKKATIVGVGTHNGNPVNFVAVEIDNGPGVPGFFSLQTSDGYSVGGSLVSGSIAIGR
jgi:hypothetical protein